MGKLPWVEDEAKCKQVGLVSNHTYHESLLSHRYYFSLAFHSQPVPRPYMTTIDV